MAVLGDRLFLVSSSSEQFLCVCCGRKRLRRVCCTISYVNFVIAACASAVTAALGAADDSTADGGDVDVRGESLLLPLLQGLLGGGGERLLAGLGAAGADVVADVRRSLGRLRSALAPPTQHPQARALLALADRLEDALDAADRLDGCKRRPRRRTRASRHTVGVTHEELEEARRLVDRDQLALGADRRDRKDATPSTDSAAASSAPSEEPPTPDRRLSVDEENGYHHEAVAVRQKHAPIAHNASYEAAPRVSRDALVVERRAPAPRKPDFFRHSIADAQQQPPPTALPHMERRPSEGKSGIAAIANKFNAQMQKETVPPPIRRAPASHPHTLTAPTFSPKTTASEELKRAPLYKPLPPTYNFAAPPPPEDFSKPMNRFGSNKRLRMKRANTIDIGRPLAGYRMDSDTDEESGLRPAVPAFEPRTENDKKFVAFMKKNEANGVVNGHANWSNRFGNIKNTFESRERDERSPSGGSGGARRTWEPPAAPRAVRKVLGDANHGADVVKPPWAAERRDAPPPRSFAPPRLQMPPPVPTHLPLPQSPGRHAPHTPPGFPSVCLSPTKPVVVKPFAAKPIPVNQFSHAPMSAFKPPKKITSPTSAPALVWSPPSVGYPVSPTVEPPPTYPSNSRISAASPPAAPWNAPEAERLRRTAGLASKFENRVDNRVAPPPSTPPKFNSGPLPSPTFAAQQTYAPPPNSGFPVKSIPSQSNLAAPELVKKLDAPRPAYDPSTQAYRHPLRHAPPSQQYDSSKQIFDPQKIDAQKLQIEFYEKQIREKMRRDAPTHPQKVPAPSQPYTVTDYTPANLVSTFVPLHQTPDIEKARAHKVDYLPDVVMNETGPYEYGASPTVTERPTRAYAPKTKAPSYTQAVSHQNGDVNRAEDGEPAMEHGRVETRVMRGPVRGAATITAGVRTRNDEARRPAADSLRGVLDKVAAPRTPVERRRDSRAQVPASPLQNGHSPSPHAHATPPSIAMSRSPLAASRDSLASAESASSQRSQASFGSSPLSRSGSWHQLAQPAPAPKAPSPRRVVSRAKSLHLLAVPKLYEGGIGREEITEKKRTVEAYFGGLNGQSHSGVVTATSASKTHAANIKSRAARSTPAQGGFALGRSRTMPTVSELQFLDESNTDDAFEDLVSGLA